MYFLFFTYLSVINKQFSQFLKQVLIKILRYVLKKCLATFLRIIQLFKKIKSALIINEIFLMFYRSLENVYKARTKQKKGSEINTSDAF